MIQAKKQTALILAAIVAVLLLVALAVCVQYGVTLNSDQMILRAINGYAHPLLDSFFVGFTQLGGVYGVAGITLLIAGYCVYRRIYVKALIVSLGVGGVALINLFLKVIFERTRPDLWTWIVEETSFSFPSGHASASAALALCVVILLWRTPWRYYAVAFAGAYTALIGLSRMYLGVHYPTDIIGGWLLAVAWVSLASFVVHHLAVRKQSKPREIS